MQAYEIIRLSVCLWYLNTEQFTDLQWILNYLKAAQLMDLQFPAVRNNNMAGTRTCTVTDTSTT